MIRKLVVVLLTGVMCLVGVTSALAVTYNEAPMLRTMVAAGELPPVEERLPEEPSVVEPLGDIAQQGEIGQYGGTMQVFAIDGNPWNDMTESPERGHALLRFAKDRTVEGSLAKGYKLSGDGKDITLYLRKGAKWSDGVPFTADDIVFTYEDMHWNKKVQTWGGLRGVMRVKKIDDYTVRLEMDLPNPRLLLDMARVMGSSWGNFHPKHYLKKWHIKYNPDADKLAKEEGYDHWYDCLYHHFWWAPQKDLNKPTMQPWILKKFTTTAKVFERNPYYWRVDTAGNQLPYIDRIVSTIVTQEVYQLKIISGEADIAVLYTSLVNYPLYKENEEEGGYRVVLAPGTVGSHITFCFNLNYPDPALRKIYQDVRYRQALSLALNRKEINDTCYFGLAVPGQVTNPPSCSYYKKERAEAYAQYDPDEAKRLLDEVGLTEKDKDGFRIGPDGKAMLLLVEYPKEEYTTPLELVKEYWEDVGLKVMLKLEEPSYYGLRYASIERGIIARENRGRLELLEYLDQGDTLRARHFAPAWGLWLDAKKDIAEGRKTLEEFEGGKLPGQEPPEEIKELHRWMDERSLTKFGSKEYMELSHKIHDFLSKKLFLIGTVGLIPQILIAKENIGNVPNAHAPATAESLDLLNHFADQLFFKQ